jgi:hypothetical protein
MFVVEFFPPSGSLDNSGLTEQQTEQLRDEGELSEYFETPEEAAELYLLLESHYRDRLLPKKVAFGQESDTPENRPPRKSVSSYRHSMPTPLRMPSPRQRNLSSSFSGRRGAAPIGYCCL